MLPLQVTSVLFLFILKACSQHNIRQDNDTYNAMHNSSVRRFPFAQLHSVLGLVSVNTPNGLVLGRRMTSAGRREYFYAFRGIPYAEPPIDSLRFQPPVPYSRRTLYIDAKEDRSKCIQPSMDITLVAGSEDCLFINVYVSTINLQKRLPVLVFIHGGGFLFGSGQYLENGPDFLLDNDIIYVSFNYRLGPFGFLSTEDMVLPGNNGLKDQLLALKWIKKNIHYFGGNPEEVTLMGQSAGSTSVSYLAQSNLASGLFKRAIMLSGNTLCPWSLARNPRKTAFQIGSSLGIQTNSSRVLISALSILPAKLLTLTTLATSLLTDNALNLIIAPVKEPHHSNSVFSDRSYRIASKEKLNPEDIMIGFTNAEGIAFLYTNDPNYYTRESFLVPTSMHIENQTVKDIVRQQVLDYYYPNSTISLENVFPTITDNYFVRGSLKYIKLASVRNNIFAFVFSYLGNLASHGSRRFNGVGHGEDLAYIFKHFNEPSPITESDLTTRLRWVKLITNFAIYGSPTPTTEELFDNVIWNSVPASGDLRYLDIGENLSMKKNPRAEQMRFWDRLFETYAIKPYDTYYEISGLGLSK